jgi:putative FmdB family regulatory protein
MPVYEYRRQKCAHVFTNHFHTWRATKEEDAPSCPACGAREVRRLLSAASAPGGGEASTGEAVERTATPDRPRLFGRKELNQAREERKRTG